MNAFTEVFLLMFTAVTLTQYWLARRQAAYVLANRESVPAAFTQTVSLAAHEKAADYTLANQNLVMLSVVLAWC